MVAQDSGLSLSKAKGLSSSKAKETTKVVTLNEVKSLKGILDKYVTTMMNQCV